MSWDENVMGTTSRFRTSFRRIPLEQRSRTSPRSRARAGYCHGRGDESQAPRYHALLAGGRLQIADFDFRVVTRSILWHCAWGQKGAAETAQLRGEQQPAGNGTAEVRGLTAALTAAPANWTRVLQIHLLQRGLCDAVCTLLARSLVWLRHVMGARLKDKV